MTRSLCDGPCIKLTTVKSDTVKSLNVAMSFCFVKKLAALPLSHYSCIWRNEWLCGKNYREIWNELSEWKFLYDVFFYSNWNAVALFSELTLISKEITSSFMFDLLSRYSRTHTIELLKQENWLASLTSTPHKKWYDLIRFFFLVSLNE